MNIYGINNLDSVNEKEVEIREEHSLPITGSATLVASTLAIILVHSGSAKVLMDMQPYEFKTHSINIMLPDHIVSNGECTEDYSTTIILIARKFYEELIHRESFMGYLRYRSQPNFVLSQEEHDKTMTFINALRLIVDSEHPKRHETLANLLDIIFYATTRYRGEEQNDQNNSICTPLFNSFYELLIKNYHLHHDVIWYAEKLCLTPKYFSSVIRKTTGKSAAQWIDEVLTLHAKRLLHTRRDLTVQQVAYELGFKENATFCRFFKDQTGLRPSEYRKGK